MAKRQTGRTSFWTRSLSGPWPEAALARFRAALDTIAAAVRAEPDVAALIVFGSFARGDFGRRSDVDLLVLFRGSAERERSPVTRRLHDMIGQAEADHRLPMHLAPLFASVGDRAALPNALLRDIWRDGVVLHGDASTLAELRPEGLVPWSVVRFSVHGTPAERVRLSRQLHGHAGRPGLVQRPAIRLGRGALLIPVSQETAVRAALDGVGATYDIIAAWRET